MDEQDVVDDPTRDVTGDVEQKTAPKKFETREVHSDGHEGATAIFLEHKDCKPPGNQYSHLIIGGLLGGTFLIPEIKEGEFRERLRQDFEQRQMLSITEVRTVVFRFYADLDLKVPVQKLTEDAVFTIVRIMNSQAQRFFPEDHPPLICIVCDKSGEAKAEQCGAAALGIAETRYKHGLHLHWPNVCVKCDDALRMRASMIAALERTDWTDLLGTTFIDWDSTVDESVYGSSTNSNSGLRMVGAPKAIKCKCRNKGGCKDCSKRGYIIDPRHYKAFAAFNGNELDDYLTRRIKNNFSTLLDKTTIRTTLDRHDISKGWRAYAGCPNAVVKDGRGKKRKGTDAGGMEGKLAKKSEIKDSDIEAVIRKYLIKFSPHYSQSTLRITFDGKHTYMASLRGDGANFCLNLKPNCPDGGFHNSQNVYIQITAKNIAKNEYVATMRCFCRCPTKEGRYNKFCSEFMSNPQMLDGKDVNTLYKRGKTPEMIFLNAQRAWKDGQILGKR
jgi:hypothetical protein